MNDTASFTSLQQQCAYRLDVDVRKGENITGGFGKRIYKAEWIDRVDSPVVLLEMKGDKAIKEAILYITLHHPHIIKTFGFVSPNVQTRKSESILLLQEYAEARDLAGMLSNQYFIPSQSVLIEIFIQVSDAMIYLSQHHIIHGDLACRNVLVFKSDPFKPIKNLVKLIDFGLTQDDSISLNVQIDIPERYVAPEIIRSKGHSGYSEKSDVYSFAVLMWEACSFGKIPYDYISDDKEVCRQKLIGEKLKQPEKCDSNTWKLMLLCWNDRPEDRPSFQTVHKQLKTIQNTNFSNSHLSSSPIIEDNSSLFNTAYQTCQECGLRYTDYQSHQNTCSEEELICYVCQNPFRRGVYDNHLQSCEAASNDTINKKSQSSISSSDEMQEEDFSLCQFCNTPYNTYELEDHQDNCQDNPRNHRKKVSSSRSPLRSLEDLNRTSLLSPANKQSSKRVNSFRNEENHSSSYQASSSNSRSSLYKLPQSSRYGNPIQETQLPIFRVSNRQEKTSSKILENLLISNTTQIPCDICKQLIGGSEFIKHQRECQQREDDRIERMRIEIEQRKSLEAEVECEYCRRRCFLSEIVNHQDNCSHNPENVSETPLPFQDIRQTSLFHNSSASSDDKLPNFNKTNQWPSTDSVGHQKSDGNETKTPIKVKKKEPSTFRKFISRFWPFKKK